MGGKGMRGRGSLSRPEKARASVGRPPQVSDEELLRAALRLFAEFGYEGMSVRMLNLQLGISHNTVNNRYGSKLNLWYAAVDLGFSSLRKVLVTLVMELQGSTDHREVTRRGIGTFLRAAQQQPDILQIMNTEGATAGPRISYAFKTHLGPLTSMMNVALQDSIAEGRVRKFPVRGMMYLLGHGSSAEFTLAGLANEFDELLGPMDQDEYIEQMTEFLLAGLFID